MTDDGSGILYIDYDVFYMRPNADGVLAEIEPPVKSVDDYEPYKNEFHFTCQKPGVYSIRMIVYDRAGNHFTARKLVVYTGDDTIRSKCVTTVCVTLTMVIRYSPE